MSDQRERSAPAVYALLAGEPNLAVETALLEALPELGPDVQPVALDVLVSRARQRGLAGLIAHFPDYDAGLQVLVLARTNGLYSGLRVAVGDERVEVRLAAVELIRRSGDPKLAYLLAEGLRQPCPKTRAAAGQAMADQTAEFLQRKQQLAEAGDAATSATGDIKRLQTDGDYLARALQRAIECWDLHFRIEVLTAAMWMSDRLEEVLLTKVGASRSSFGRAVLEQLAGADDARMAGCALRMLLSPPLRTEVARRIGGCVNAEFVRGLIAESWLLTDVRIAHECMRVRRWAWLDRYSDDCSALSPAEVAGVLRLVSASGIPIEAKVTFYARMLSADTEAAQSAAFWYLASVENEAANQVLRTLAQRNNGHLSDLASKELRRRALKNGQGRTAAQDTAPGTQQDSDFDACWAALDHLADAHDFAAQARQLLHCTDWPIHVRARLDSGDPAQRTRGLRVIRALKVADSLSDAVYRLANDPDPVTRSQAIAVLVDLPGPTAQRIAQRSLNDPDPRVQSNAIEALADLSAEQCRAQATSKLNSDHHRVRATAAATLLKLEVSEAAEALLDMLDEPSAAHRISALWVVERLQLGSLVMRLAEMAQADPDQRVRRRAARALRMMPAAVVPAEVGVSAG